MKTHYICFAIALFLAAAIGAFAQGTAFTYQGRLNNGTNVASGNYDLTFSLWNSASGPAQVGATMTNAATAINNGLFTVTLDFGNQFPGAGRWLEIGVRTNGGGAFATLSPRQALTSTPYAVNAANAGTATVAATASSVAAANITGTIPLAQLPPMVVTNGASGVNITGTFSGNAGGLSNLNSAKLTGPLNMSLDPLNIGHTNEGGFKIAYGVAVSGNYAYLANFDDGLRVYDISNPANPLNIGHALNNPGFPNPGWAYGVAVSGNYAYLANGLDGLRVYDISNPANPLNIGHSDVGGDDGEALSVAVSGNYAYLANGLDGLRMYDISNPASPLNIGHSDTNYGGYAQGVAVSGNYAYLANWNDGLRVYDISNPANPLNIGHINDDEVACGVTVSGNYAYLANGLDGLRVYNISNPASPLNIGHIDNGGFAWAVAVSGNYAYLANDSDGLRVYDISNPANPLNMGHIVHANVVNASAWAVAVSGNYAYVANYFDGLRVYALGVVSSGSFLGDGSGLTGLNASQLASGTVSDARLSTNASLLGSSIESAEITDGTIVDADISITAAIADTKLAMISSTNKVADSALSTNVARRAGGNTFTGNQIVTNGNVGIGNPTPGYPTPPFPLSLSTNLGDKISLWGGLGDHYGFGIQGNQLQVHVDSASSHILFGYGQSTNFTERMRIMGNGNVGIGTSNPTNKLHVAGGVSATAFVNTSDRNAKENFASVSPLDVLKKVTALPITTWNFKDMKDGRHMGPMAQDFYAAFGLGGGDTTITSVDPDGVALAAIQGLNQKLETENAELKRRVEKLERLMSERTGGAK